MKSSSLIAIVFLTLTCIATAGDQPKPHADKQPVKNQEQGDAKAEPRRLLEMLARSFRS